MITFMIGFGIFMVVNLIVGLALRAGVNWWLDDLSEKWRKRNG